MLPEWQSEAGERLGTSRNDSPIEIFGNPEWLLGNVNGGRHMMDRPTHRQLQEQLPDYLLSRLDETSAQQISTHLATCEECAEFVSAVEPFAAGMRDGDASLLEEHPESGKLTAYGVGEIEDADGSIERHLQTCLSCRLEVDVWKEQGQAPGFGLPARNAPATIRRFKPYRLAAAAAVAGLLLGAGLSNLFIPGSAPGSDWTGAVGLTVLERPLRSEAAPTTVRLEAGQPYVPLAVAPQLPAGAESTDLFRFEIEGAGGILVWSQELDANRIRETLGATGVVTFLVPSTTLDDERYRLRFRRVEQGSEPLLELPFEVQRP
jgi:hypothetical protein